MNISGQGLCTGGPSLGFKPEAGLLGQCVNLQFHGLLPCCLPKRLSWFKSHQSIQISYYTTSSSVLGVVEVLMFANQMGMKWHLIVMLIVSPWSPKKLSLFAFCIEVLWIFCSFPFKKKSAAFSYLRSNSRTLSLPLYNVQFSGFCILTKLYIYHPQKKSHTQ